MWWGGSLPPFGMEAVGGFDEDYFAYYEDIDWAFRAQLAGVRCRYVPTAVLYHRGSATLGQGYDRQQWLSTLAQSDVADRKVLPNAAR